MWYAGRPVSWPSAPLVPNYTAHGLAGLALSPDGLVWDRVDGPMQGGSVLAPNEDWWAFDTVHLSVGSVAIDSSDIVRADAGVYFMYYAGGNRQAVSIGGNDVPGARTAIGVAISKDGEHFTRVEGEHPSGAVLQPGDEGAFDQLLVAGPFVTRPRKPLKGGWKYVMHYFTLDEGRRRFAIGRALSRDGLKFERAGSGPVITGDGEVFAEKGVMRCCVVERTDGLFVMFVECIDGDGVHRIAMTESEDCAMWGRLKVVLGPGEGDAWDAKGVSHPSAVMMDEGKVRLYYVGRGSTFDTDKGTGSGVGVAESEGEDWAVLRRIQTAGGTE